MYLSGALVRVRVRVRVRVEPPLELSPREIIYERGARRPHVVITPRSPSSNPNPQLRTQRSPYPYPYPYPYP